MKFLKQLSIICLLFFNFKPLLAEHKKAILALYGSRLNIFKEFSNHHFASSFADFIDSIFKEITDQKINDWRESLSKNSKDLIQTILKI